VQGSSNINKTSYVENCETSAIGRALAMLGIGIDTSIASANEVSDAISKQDKAAPATPTKDKKMIQKVQEKFDADPPENIMDKAVAYIKSQSDKKKAYESIMSKYKDSLSEKQVAGLKKFVR
jgi:hypothetical protein